jgi:hypothetical protein
VKREHQDILFNLVLVLVIGWGVFEARQWDARARLFPWAIGIPLLALLLIHLALQVRAVAGAPRPVNGDLDYGVNPAVARRRTAVMVAWLLGFAVVIGLLGFAVGGTLATLAYLRLAARERWPISLAITAGTGAFFVVLIRLLNIPFPPGILLERLLA